MMDEPVPGHWLCPVRARLGASDFGRGVAKGRWCGEQGGGGAGDCPASLGGWGRGAVVRPSAPRNLTR